MTSTGRWRPARWLSAFLLIVASIGCTGDDDDDDASAPPTTEAPGPRMTVSRADLVSAHRAASPLDAAAADVAVSTLELFYAATVSGPLATGEPGDLFHLVTPDVLEHATGADRAVVFDHLLGPVDAALRGRTEVRLTALAGEDDRPALVVAKLDWDVRTADGAVRIRRTGELSMLPQYGGLRIAAYELTVERAVDGRTTSTTASAGTVGS